MPQNIARQNMIDGQLRPNGITNNALLAQFNRIPRDSFLEGSAKETPYADMPLPLSETRQMFSPLIQARLIQALSLQSTHKVLIIGSGTGYSTALMAPLCHHITALEDNKHLQDIARYTQQDLALKNITLRHGALTQGASQNAPYDRILFDIPVNQIPPAVSQQLAPNGLITAVIEGEDGLMEITTILKKGKTLVHTPLYETKTMPLPEIFQTEETFIF